MNEIGRHVTLAIIKYQERGAREAASSRSIVDFRSAVLRGHAIYHQRQSATEYATARKLMNI